MTVAETGAAAARQASIRPRTAGQRERWLRRLPLLPALIYVVVVTQVPFVVTLWYSFENYFWDQPGSAHFTGLAITRRSSPARRSAAHWCGRWS